MRLIDGDPQGCRTLEPLRRTVPYPESTGHCAVPFRHWLAGLPWRGLESDQLSPTYEAGVLPVHHPNKRKSRLHDSPIRIVPHACSSTAFALQVSRLIEAPPISHRVAARLVLQLPHAPGKLTVRAPAVLELIAHRP